MLSVDKINVFYGEVQSSFDVTFNVNKGEIVAIIGPNAAGKSTILKTISGLIRPKSGSISFNGKRIENLPSNRIVDLGVVLIPEGRLPFPYMSVYENLEMGAYSRRSRDKKAENMERVYQLFPVLKERRDQLAGTLSGGEQQMLAIARGLMACPELLMLDEPSLGLGPKILHQIFRILEEINRGGVMILLVEQNVKQTLKLAQRAYVLESGRIVLEGGAKELLENKHVKKAYLGL